MKKNHIIQLLITISTIGLGIAMIPELYKVIKKPETVKDLSPVYLCLRTLFFILLGVGLFLKKDKHLLLLVILCGWYTLCYMFFLIMYLYN